MTLIDELRQYLLTSNVVSLAIGVTFGQTFSSFISSFVTHLIYPLLSIIFYKIDFKTMNIDINGNVIDYGNVINAFLTFIISMLTVFFIFIRPVNNIVEKHKNTNTKI
jgi:large conductance mechanosensitive channel